MAHVFSREFIKKTSRLTNTWTQPYEFADAKVKLDDESEFYVNKYLLAASSLFFEKLFTHQNGTSYDIRNVSRSSFEQILSWIYKQKIRLTLSNVADIMKEADYLACHEVVSQCYQFIVSKINYENAIDVHRFCMTFNFVLLENKSR